MKFILGIFVGFILLCVLIGFGIMTYLGFVPGLSTALGFNKAKDLGITITAADSTAAQSKTGVEILAMPAGTAVVNSIKYEGSKNATYEMNSTELTGLSNNRKWKYYPLENVQVRVNDDGTVESTGVIKLDSAFNYVRALGYSQEDIDKAMNEMKIPRMNLPFYVKFGGNVKDNVVNLSVDSLVISNVPVPASYITEHTSDAAKIVEDLIAKSNGFSIKSLSFSDGRMYFDGTVPEKEYVVE
jgi:hypothetical protein